MKALDSVFHFCKELINSKAPFGSGIVFGAFLTLVITWGTSKILCKKSQEEGWKDLMREYRSEISRLTSRVRDLEKELDKARKTKGKESRK